MPLATIGDIETHLGRGLKPIELILAPGALAAASTAAATVHPDAHEQAVSDPNYAYALVRTEASIAAHLVTLNDTYTRAQINHWTFLYGAEA